MEPSVERATITPASPAWGDNRSRYHFAGKHVEGKVVLDVACGSGYGSVILQEHGAAFVVGCDASEIALKQARDVTHEGIALTRASGTGLPLKNDTVDVVVSLETIEHIGNDTAFVRELARVLSTNGVAVLSTPNARYTKPVDGVPANPFHVREYTSEELESTLSRSFGSVELLGQRPSERFNPCPFWELPENLPTDAIGRMRVRWWKLQDRLFSDRTKDRLSRLLRRRSFYPGEFDFSFTSDGTNAGHVLVAMCRGPQT